jgi:hypothetical protein
MGSNILSGLIFKGLVPLRGASTVASKRLSYSGVFAKREGVF